MKLNQVFRLLLVLIIPIGCVAQSDPSTEGVEPFKLGTFEVDGQHRLGIVLRDNLVIDLVSANTALQKKPGISELPMPSDMLELIERYESVLKHRLYEIVNDLNHNNGLEGSGKSDFVYEVSDLRALPPIMYPSKNMNAAVNFYTHACEGCTEEELQARTRARQENRGVPYLFLKPTRGAIIGSGDDIVIPYGRDRI